jgi:hypothetical protein
VVTPVATEHPIRMPRAASETGRLFVFLGTVGPEALRALFHPVVCTVCARQNLRFDASNCRFVN